VSSPIPALKPSRAPAIKRFILLIVIPVLALVIAGTFYLRGGRYVSTENAYVKTNIIAVSADVSGRTLPGIVVNNQIVKQGDVLFSIDASEFQLKVEEARAALELVRTEVETQRAEHNEVQVSITEAQERIAYYQRQFQRHQSLKKEGIGSAQAADDAQFNLTSALQSVKVLDEKSVRMLTPFKGDAAMPVERHPAFERASVHYKQALSEQEKTLVKAPVAGIVSNNSLQAGEFITAGTPVFSLIENGQVWIEANLKETQLTHLHEGQQAIVSIDAYPGVEWKATVATIAPATGAEFSLLPPQNATGNWVKVVQRVPVSLAIETDEHHPVLRAGMTAAVRIDTRFSREFPSVVQPLLGWLSVDFGQEKNPGSLQAAEPPPATNSAVVTSFATNAVVSEDELIATQTSVQSETESLAQLTKSESTSMLPSAAGVASASSESAQVLPESIEKTTPIVSTEKTTAENQWSELPTLDLLDDNWIKELPGHLYTLQVGTSTDRDKLIEFAGEFKDDLPMMVYFHRQNENNERVFALAVGLYRSRLAARSALSRLPALAARFKPWIRRISDMQERIDANGS